MPTAPHDLRVDAALHELAERVPGDDDDAPVWVGALAPDVDARCALRDPAPPPRRTRARPDSSRVRWWTTGHGTPAAC